MQGPPVSGTIHRAALRGAPLRLVPTRANGQPAFDCYLPDAHGAIARPYGLMVLTLDGDVLAGGVALDLVALDPPDGEVVAVGVGEVETAHR